MAEIKTKITTQDPKDFLSTIEPEQKKAEGFELLELFQKITGEKPVMWGTSIVGFSPRKQNLSLYIMAGNKDNTDLLAKLGKHKTSVGCLYINTLADVDQEVLAKLIKNSYEFMKKTYKIEL